MIKPIKTTDVEEVRPIGSPGPVASSTSAAVAAALPAFKQEPKGGKQPYSDEAWARAQRNEAAVPPVAVVAATNRRNPHLQPLEKPVAAASDEVADWVWPTAGKVGTPFAEGSSKGIDIPGQERPAGAGASGAR